MLFVHCVRMLWIFFLKISLHYFEWKLRPKTLQDFLFILLFPVFLDISVIVMVQCRAIFVSVFLHVSLLLKQYFLSPKKKIVSFVTFKCTFFFLFLNFFFFFHAKMYSSPIHCAHIFHIRKFHIPFREKEKWFLKKNRKKVNKPIPAYNFNRRNPFHA